ncbi:hypothetical protein M9H77_10358 [Catharanthus roseus]|uniref:Uncharacterized protein n=1 Tax=Catharanthus roseus TaxID=4058 RepID=A0ACC0C3S4_CATRO|nr:hypothetical protein M9H77_10358 [Catharanthus roseus]
MNGNSGTTVPGTPLCKRAYQRSYQFGRRILRGRRTMSGLLFELLLKCFESEKFLKLGCFISVISNCSGDL